jgi:hypothetical protein
MSWTQLYAHLRNVSGAAADRRTNLYTCSAIELICPFDQGQGNALYCLHRCADGILTYIPIMRVKSTVFHLMSNKNRRAPSRLEHTSTLHLVFHGLLARERFADVFGLLALAINAPCLSPAIGSLPISYYGSASAQLSYPRGCCCVYICLHLPICVAPSIASKQLRHR